MKNITKLGLGTVQWGVPYGISNQSGKTPPEAVAEILLAAQRYGVSILDTASQYGNAESTLGKNVLSGFNVVTKTPSFGTPYIADSQARQLLDTFDQSLNNLGLRSTYGILIHHAADLLVPGGEKLVSSLLALKEKNKVKKIGVSIYDGSQIDQILNRFKPDIVQAPVNVLDQRLLTSGKLQQLKDLGVEIHIRSVFLQGLLLMSLDKLPTYFGPISPLLTQWHSAAEAQGMTLTQAALSFVRDIPYVDAVLVGVESPEQFHTCANDFSITQSFDARGLSCENPAFVNPALWKTL